MKEIEQNELISINLKKFCISLIYIEKFLILASMIIGCVSISSFASLVGITIEITSSAMGLKMWAITASNEMYKSIIKKMNHGKLVLLAKIKLNSI